MFEYVFRVHFPPSDQGPPHPWVPEHPRVGWKPHRSLAALLGRRKTLCREELWASAETGRTGPLGTGIGSQLLMDDDYYYYFWESSIFRKHSWHLRTLTHIILVEVSPTSLGQEDRINPNASFYSMGFQNMALYGAVLHFRILEFPYWF